MRKEEIQDLIRDLVEKMAVEISAISVAEEKPGNFWISLEVKEPHIFLGRDGEGLQALNHLVHRILEGKGNTNDEKSSRAVLVDINGFQKKHVENIKAIAHMMSERARYFKSNIEVDPMTAFERRIVHEFLADAQDLKTESVGAGRSRRVVIKYLGNSL